MTNSPTPGGLVGRQDIIDEVVTSLVAPEWQGSLIIGEPGMGKTAVAAAALALGKGRFRAFHAFASPLLSSEPYGALAPFLTGLPLVSGSLPSVILRTLLAALRTGTDEYAVLVIDDAHFLDDDSVVLLAQVAAASSTKLIFLCSPFPTPPAELWSMCSDGLLKSLVLAPLSTETLQELCLEILGPQVLPGTNIILSRRAAGNPLYLLELIDQARQSHDLIQIDGVWLLVREPSGSTPRMRDTVEKQLMQLPETSRRALNYVALAVSLDLDSLYEVADRAAVDDLEEAGLITILKLPSRRVQFASSRMGEVTAELLPTAKALAMRRQLLVVANASQDDAETLIRHVAWALEAGQQVSDSDALLTAQLGNAKFMSELAEKAAAAVASPDLHSSAQLEAAKATLWRGDRRRFSRRIDEILKQSSNPEVVRLAAGVCGHVGLRPGLDSTALADLAVSWRESVQRLERSGILRDDSGLAEHYQGLRLLEIQGIHSTGNYRGTEHELAAIHESVGADTMNAVVSATLLCAAMTASGRMLEALESSSRAAELLARDDGRLAQMHEFVVRRQLSALWHAGKIDELRNLVDKELELSAPSLLVYGGSLHLAKGLCDLDQGAINDGLLKLIQAVAALQGSDPGNDLPLGLAAAAYAAAVLGKEPMSEKYATLFEDAAPGRDAAASLLARGYLLAARGLFEGNPRPGLRRVVDEAAAVGMIHIELEMLMLGVYAGDLGLAPRLKAVALTCQGLTAEHALAYATAITAKDAKALMAFSAEAESDGRELAAARSAAHAVILLTRRGDRNHLHSAQRLAKRSLARLMYGRSPLSERLNSVPQLTRRERKVAALVQEGASNKEIAAAFGLSLRTVEGHLYRIFAKLGVSDRSEIAKTAAESLRF